MSTSLLSQPNIEAFMVDHPALSVVGFTVLLLGIRQMVVSLPLRASKKSVGRSDEQTARAKMGESLWFFIYYTFAFAFETACLWDTQYMWDISSYWKEFPHSPAEFPFGLRTLYSIQIAFYISASIVILFLNNTRAKHRDKLIMLTHHAVTLTLTIVSLSLGEHRIGAIILFLHDISDIFLEGAKLARYIGYANLENPLFAIFALFFFVFRLILLPWRALYAIYAYYPIGGHYQIHLCDAAGVCSSYVLFTVSIRVFWLTLLGSLQLLHIYWFVLIFTMIVKALKEGKIDKDIRSDDESIINDEQSPDVKRRRSPHPKDD